MPIVRTRAFSSYYAPAVATRQYSCKVLLFFTFALCDILSKNLNLCDKLCSKPSPAIRANVGIV